MDLYQRLFTIDLCKREPLQLLDSQTHLSIPPFTAAFHFPPFLVSYIESELNHIRILRVHD